MGEAVGMLKGWMQEECDGGRELGYWGCGVGRVNFNCNFLINVPPALQGSLSSAKEIYSSISGGNIEA